jgi:hypothetical protein
MKNKIKKLKKDILNEIYRLQMLDYPSPKSYDYLNKMQNELEKLNTNRPT